MFGAADHGHFEVRSFSVCVSYSDRTRFFTMHFQCATLLLAICPALVVPVIDSARYQLGSPELSALLQGERLQPLVATWRHVRFASFYR